MATAATKVILGIEEAALADVRDVFGLSEDEIAAINPPVQGRAVLLSGGERTVVSIVPGPALLALANSSPVPRSQPATAAVRLGVALRGSRCSACPKSRSYAR